jgi:cation diffusion facilitator CzcD-associated flavoprotein CzcO
MNTTLPVAIIGAGPVGLAAAAHLIQRGETPLLFEAGTEIAASVRSWGHVRLFSPWRWCLDKAAVALLEADGWQTPDLDHLPTGHELIDRYLLPLAQLPTLRTQIHLGARVTAVSRRRIDKLKDAGREDAPFVVQVEIDGHTERFLVRAVIDAAGTWTTPNPIGADGLAAPGEAENATRIAYGIPDVLGREQARYAGKRVAVIGGGHSAINAILDLAELHDSAPQTHITWVLRKQNVSATYGGGENDQLPGRGQLGLRIQRLVEAGAIEVVTPFFTTAIERADAQLRLVGDTPQGERSLLVDEVIGATGARPDLSFLREVRLDLDPSVEAPRALAPLIDPNLHSCGTVRPHGEKELRQPDAGYYVVGMKSYGRAPTFLLATGYEQVRSIVAALVGDWEAAAEVQLDLPETGVCSVSAAFDGRELGIGSACCATPAQDAPAVAVELLPLTMLSTPASAEDGSCCGVTACCTPDKKVEVFALQGTAKADSCCG